jgi:hypothetical protein
MTIDGEANAFRQLYEQDLDSDESDLEPEESLPRDMPMMEESLDAFVPAWKVVRDRAAKLSKASLRYDIPLLQGADSVGSTRCRVG